MLNQISTRPRILPLTLNLLVLNLAIAPEFFTSPAFADETTSKSFPAEQQLPGSGPRAGLPPESELPGEVQSVSANSGTDPPPTPREPVDENALPDQRVPRLPAAASGAAASKAAASGAAADPDDRGSGNGEFLGEEESSGELRPILRLDYETHTALVRAMSLSSDGRYLLSGGDDKDVHVWRRRDHRYRNDSKPNDSRPSERPSNFAAGQWDHFRTLRWQVWRGPRGRVYSLATPPVAGDDSRVVAVGGHGAMGGLGEIWLVDFISGDRVAALVDVDRGHRQTIGQLCWEPRADNPRLASQDLDGQVCLWNIDPATGLWKMRVIVPVDSQVQSPATAFQLQPHRRFVSHAFRGPGELVVPQFQEFRTVAGQPTPIWKLSRFDLKSGKSQLLVDSEFAGHVRQLSCSADGRTLAASGDDDTIAVWKFNDRGEIRSKSRAGCGGRVSGLVVDPDGIHLTVGTEIAARVDGRDVSRLQRWSSRDALRFECEVYPPAAVAAVVSGVTAGLPTKAAGDGRADPTGHEDERSKTEPNGQSNADPNAETAGVAVAFAAAGQHLNVFVRESNGDCSSAVLKATKSAIRPTESVQFVDPSGQSGGRYQIKLRGHSTAGEATPPANIFDFSDMRLSVFASTLIDTTEHPDPPASEPPASDPPASAAGIRPAGIR